MINNFRIYGIQQFWGRVGDQTQTRLVAYVYFLNVSYMEVELANCSLVNFFLATIYTLGLRKKGSYLILIYCCKMLRRGVSCCEKRT